MRTGLVGHRGERRAERLLRRKGLRVVARNWRCRHGEIDRVMLDGPTLVFVEVRLRGRADWGDGVESVNAAKRTKLVRAASMFLAEHPDRAGQACRFDVVGIDGDGNATWVRDAFPVDG